VLRPVGSDCWRDIHRSTHIWLWVGRRAGVHVHEKREPLLKQVLDVAIDGLS
jgi:hypothetical protein